MQTPGIAKNARKQGFTLIELSIVLVIIGLIVGGVLVGQDLIRAAEIRATVSQYEKYNAAINTFRSKYNGIPGDLLMASATAFGLCPTAGCTAGTAGLGDGNGLIQDAAGNSTPVGEPLMFWQQLSSANLVDGAYGQLLTAGGGVGAGATPAQYLPAAKMGRGNVWAAGSDTGFNYYVLGNISAIAATYTTVAVSITPVEAFNIDSKVDDSQPNTGTVQARGAFANAFASTSAVAAPWAAASTAANCTMGGATSTDAADTYNRNQASGGNTPSCWLRLRFN